MNLKGRHFLTLKDFTAEEIDDLETALAVAKQEAKDADAALEAKLVGEITALETELLAKVTELQDKHNKDIADLKKIVDDNKAAADAQFKVVADQGLGMVEVKYLGRHNEPLIL